MLTATLRLPVLASASRARFAGSARKHTHTPEGLSTAPDAGPVSASAVRHERHRLDLDQNPRPREAGHGDHGDRRRVLAPGLARGAEPGVHVLAGRVVDG